MIDESYGKFCNASRNVTKLKNMIAVVEKEMDRLRNQDYQLGQYKMQFFLLTLRWKAMYTVSQDSYSVHLCQSFEFYITSHWSESHD